MKINQEKFSNKTIAHLLRSIAAVYLLTNEIRFKVIAYEKAADTVEHLSRELKDVWEEGKLINYHGIGPTISEHLSEYFQKGYSVHFDKILKKVPATVFELMKIPSIGPKKAYKLVKTLKLLNEKTLFEDLKQACLNHKIDVIPTFGEKSETDILKALEIFERKIQKTSRMPLPYAFEIAEELKSYLSKNQFIKRIDALGSLRRMVSTIGDIDIAVVAHEKDAAEIVKYFIKYPKKLSVEGAGDKKASIIVRPNIRIDLRVQEERNYGSMLQYFTGSKAHNIKLREFANKKGFSLSEYGIKGIKNYDLRFKNKEESLKTFSNEKEFYKFLGLQYIPPEIREGTDEIELAEQNKLPKLVEISDIKGDFHIHSSYDVKPSHDLGTSSIEEIAEKAISLDYEYIGFSDHNPSVSTNSKDEIVEILKKRKEYIQKIFERNKYKLHYFIGLEVDILPDGLLALPEKAFQYLDYVIVSVHSSFQMDRKRMTERVLKALQFPKVKIFGHPTGRLLEKRDGYELEWEQIFKTCKKNNIAVEINSWPLRLDLPDVLVREANQQGVSCVINTDSHAVDQMKFLSYGVSVARRGWLKKSDIINTKTDIEIRGWMMKGGE
jgi:DNA polymerase (family 10)